MPRFARVVLGLAMAAALTAILAPAAGAAPQPGSLDYVQRDNRNMEDAWGRVFGRGGQVENPNYMPALLLEGTDNGLKQLAEQVAAPNRPALTPGNVFPGWNVGNPLRRGWSGSRGLRVPVAYTNRYGALIRGNVFAPLPGARDPYTRARLKPPYPGVVITTGSIQGSERMYVWLAQDLAERGYVVLTYDVQGQGTSESVPHENDQVNALPFCNPFAPPKAGESFGCPGVPAQQDSNFVFGTRDALTFFLSTPNRRYRSRAAGDTPVSPFNPLWRWFDRSRDRRTVTLSRTTRVGIIGHSLGASAVSQVQGVDRRVSAVVALDKLSGGGESGFGPRSVKPVVPALGVQSEYGFNVQPYWASHGSSLAPQPGPPNERPDPRREEKTGFDAWRKARVDTMLIVPRASTHLEYTDIPLVLPASRYGQALTSVYVQAWLDRYLKHKRAPLLARRFRYLEPVAVGKWKPVTLERSALLSFYFCSGYAIRDPGTRRRLTSTDVARVGGC